MEQREAKFAVKELLLLIPNLLKLLYRLAEDPRIPKAEKLILGMTAAYVVSPVDFLPDAIPFLGQVDDLVLIALALKRLFNAAGTEVLIEHWDGDQNLLALVDRILEYGLKFLPRPVYRLLLKKIDDHIDV